MSYVGEGAARVLGPMVIPQDNQSELHVQAVIQSGRRQLDIRVWRRGPSGFAPSRSALTLELADLDALCEGIAELLEASDGGRQVARVVWDKDEGRRLRAETEPFGTRFTARFGFWQRVRDTWKPAGDGLTLAAEQLKALQEVIETLRPRLLAPDDHAPIDSETVLRQEGLRRWPNPGADWLTAEPASRFQAPAHRPQVPERLTFHPRGIRITAVVEEHEHEHLLVLCQWRREESLWTPEDQTLSLAVPELDVLLAQLRQLADQKRALDVPTEPVLCRDGAMVRIDLVGDRLQIQRSTDPADQPGSRSDQPSSSTGQFDTTSDQPASGSDQSQSSSSQPDTRSDQPAVASVEPHRGAEQTDSGSGKSDTKSVQRASRTATSASNDTYLPYLSVPVEYLPRLGRVLAQGGMMLIFSLSEAERGELQREGSPEIAPAIEADAIVLPVESVSPAGHSIAEALVAPADENVRYAWMSPAPPEVTARLVSAPPESSTDRIQEKSGRPQAPSDSALYPPVRRLRPLGEVQLGRHLVFLYLQEEHDRQLSLQWDGYSLQIPVGEIQHLLDALRGLYYDALRGRRGQVAVPGADLHLSVHNQGSAIFVALEGESDGKVHRLSIPVGEVPSFLNAGSTALSRLEVRNIEPE